MLKVLPWWTSPWRPSLAASAWSEVTILTKPKPRDSLECGSRMMLHCSTSPYFSNRRVTSSSLRLGWIPVTKRLEPELRLPSSPRDSSRSPRAPPPRDSGGGPLSSCQQLLTSSQAARAAHTGYREHQGRRCGRESRPDRDGRRAATCCGRGRNHGARLRVCQQTLQSEAQRARRLGREQTIVGTLVLLVLHGGHDDALMGGWRSGCGVTRTGLEFLVWAMYGSRT